MIRAATIDDINSIVPLLLEFWINSPFPEFIEPDAETLYETIVWLINNENGLLHVLEKKSKVVGVVGFIMQPSWFNNNHITALELFWYVKPKYRGNGIRLLLHAKKEAQKLGANTIEMGAVPPYQLTENIYDRMGLKPTDRKYMGALNNGGFGNFHSSRGLIR